MEVTVADIKIEAIEGFEKVLQLEIIHKPNEHPIANIIYTVKEKISMSQIKADMERKLRTIYYMENEKKKIVFCGYFQKVEVESFVEQEYKIHAQLIGTSILLDEKRKNRSFQKVSMRFQDVAEKVVEENKNAIFKWQAESSKAIGMPVIQYNETNWEFAKRMASHSHTSIIVDIRTEKMVLYAGIETDSKPIVLKQKHYKTGVSSRYNKLGGKKVGLQAKDFVYYEITTTKGLEVGNCVEFLGKKLYVYSLHIKLIENRLFYICRLVGKNYFYVTKKYNDYFIGHTILGDVLETKAETLKLDLHLSDDEHDRANAYAYDWKPETGNFVYCMPKVGSTVSLYFLDNKETTGIVINCIRKNGATSPRMENTQNKRFMTEHNKTMDLDMDKLFFETDNSYAMLKMLDNAAVRFATKGNLTISARENISMNAKVICMSAPIGITMNGDKSISPRKGYFDMYTDVEMQGAYVFSETMEAETYPNINDEPVYYVPEETDWKENVLKGAGIVLSVVAVVAAFSTGVGEVAAAGGAVAAGTEVAAGEAVAAGTELVATELAVEEVAVAGTEVAAELAAQEVAVAGTEAVAAEVVAEEGVQITTIFSAASRGGIPVPYEAPAAANVGLNNILMGASASVNAVNGAYQGYKEVKAMSEQTGEDYSFLQYAGVMTVYALTAGVGDLAANKFSFGVLRNTVLGAGTSVGNDLARNWFLGAEQDMEQYAYNAAYSGGMSALISLPEFNVRVNGVNSYTLNSIGGTVAQNGVELAFGVNSEEEGTEDSRKVSKMEKNHKSVFLFPQKESSEDSDMYRNCNPSYIPLWVLEEEYYRKVVLGETNCRNVGEYRKQLQDVWDEERRKEAEQKEKKERSKLRKAIPDTWTLCTGVPSFNEYVYGATGVTFDGKE